VDLQHYWAIAERDIEIQNPITDRKLRLLDAYCNVRDELRVLDIGCGKAWLLRQWAERFAIEGTGVEINPRFLDTARRETPARGRLEFIEQAAADFEPERGYYDVVMCLGASFALGGFVATIDWMAEVVRPGGTVVIGDVILKHRPTVPVDFLLPHDAVETISVVERHGAEVSAIISASDADFERYVSHHRHATLVWGREHEEHPDHAEVLEKSRADWVHYLKVIRPHLGWSIFVGRCSGAS
jgi:SAM-dependent methyltransferase